MMSRRLFLASTAASASLVAGIPGPLLSAVLAEPAGLKLTEAEWRKRLTPAQFAVLRQADTERPFSSPLVHETRKGLFACAGCGTALFSSRTKYDSGTGWPSFWQPLAGTVVEREDRSDGMIRNEVLCHRCSGHLGHVFNDGPKPTGLRYCMNGTAMTFQVGEG